MSVADDQVLLDAVNAAILKIVQGGVMSKASDNHQIVNLNLDQLRSMRSELEQRIAAASGRRFALARFGDAGSSNSSGRCH